jgi:hypothetical protein
MPKADKTSPESAIEVPAGVAAMMAVNPVMAKAWMDMMSEGTRFLTDRLQRDMAFQVRLLACRDPMEAMQMQTEFVRETMQQYADEASRVFKMAFQSADDIGEDVSHGHKREHNDVPV